MGRSSYCRTSGVWTPNPSPRFVRRYLDGERVLTDALDRYDADVKDVRFPGPGERYEQ